MTDVVKVKKGLPAAEKYAETGGWGDLGNLLDDIGMSKAAAMKAYWPTDESKELSPRKLGRPTKSVPVSFVVMGRGFLENLKVYSVGRAKWVRLQDIT